MDTTVGCLCISFSWIVLRVKEKSPTWRISRSGECALYIILHLHKSGKLERIQRFCQLHSHKKANTEPTGWPKFITAARRESITHISSVTPELRDSFIYKKWYDKGHLALQIHSLRLLRQHHASWSTGCLPAVSSLAHNLSGEYNRFADSEKKLIMKTDKNEYWNFFLCYILQGLSCCTNRLLKVHMMYDVTATILQSPHAGSSFIWLGGTQQIASGFWVSSWCGVNMGLNWNKLWHKGPKLEVQPKTFLQEFFWFVFNWVRLVSLADFFRLRHWPQFSH